MTRPLSETLADERAWTAATNEVIAAARETAHVQPSLTRLGRAVAAMEALEQAAAERIRAERAQQEHAG